MNYLLKSSCSSLIFFFSCDLSCSFCKKSEDEQLSQFCVIMSSRDGFFFFFFYPLRKLNRQLAAAAAAKSLQLCLTLCDPIDGSPPGSPVLGLSRQEYWSWLPFPSPMHACMLSHFSHVQFCATPWTAAHQAPLSTGFSRQEHRRLKLGQILSHWLVVVRSSTGRGLMASEQCELFEESKIKNENKNKRTLWWKLRYGVHSKALCSVS